MTNDIAYLIEICISYVKKNSERQQSLLQQLSLLYSFQNALQTEDRSCAVATLSLTTGCRL